MNDDLERMLTDAGERWRAGQPPPPDADPALLMVSTPRPRWSTRRLVAVAAGVATIVALMAVPLALQGGADDGDGSVGGPAAGPPSGTQGSSYGRLTGVGVLFRAATGPIRLCDTVIGTMDLPQSSAGCSKVSVPTTGVSERWLVHTTTSGQAYSDPVRVVGILRDGVLAVEQVEQSSPQPGPAWEELPVPCPPPAGGWKPGEGAPDAWQSLNRLIEYVRSNSDRFTDVWEAHPDGPPSQPTSDIAPRSVYVVGTTGDVAKAQAELAAIFPGNLCVHPVKHSGRDLEQIARRFNDATDIPVEASVDIRRGKVSVKVAVMDEATESILDEVGRDVLLVEEPMLKPVE